ncbi:mechanosensitive ion channel [Flavobacterium lindanitolerans]|nr:mechanosensitive ion channel [Flavobacterium lindanitolerans]
MNHDSDISLVKALLFNVIRSDKRILQLPEPAVMIKDITADALLLSVLMWTTNEDYGWVVSDFLENIKKSFKEQGISNPAPKREIIIEIKNYRDTKEK